MNLKRLSFISAFALGTLYTGAIPAKPGLHTLTQPDGSSVCVNIIGDEHFRYYETPAGEMLMLDTDGTLRPMELTADGKLQAKVKSPGNLLPKPKEWRSVRLWPNTVKT